MPGSCPRGGTWGCPGGKKIFYFEHGHVAYQIDGEDEKNRMQVKLNFLKVKFILISIPTIYLSYSYNPVATNTNLRAVTLVYPCSGLNIDSNDVTDYRN